MSLQTAGGKTEQSTLEKAGKTSQQASSGSSKQSAPVAKGEFMYTLMTCWLLCYSATCSVGETSSALSNHINILTKNQSLLSALQKNLSSPNLSASIKSLAARVLASPLGRTQGMVIASPTFVAIIPHDPSESVKRKCKLAKLYPRSRLPCFSVSTYTPMQYTHTYL